MSKSMTFKFTDSVISTDKFSKILEKNDLIIFDVREKQEYEVSHIQNAIHVGYNDFNLIKTLKLIPKNSMVIVYCSVGYRSGKITNQLRENYINAYNLEGGIFKWSNSKLNLFDSNNNITKKIHGYSKDWSKWITHGEVVLSSEKSFLNIFN